MKTISARVVTALLVPLILLSGVTTAPRTARAQQAAEDEETSLLIAEARSAMNRRDFVRAGRLLDRAIQANPRRIDAYVLRASIHGARKEHTQAVALMRRARELAPTSTDVLSALGVQLILAGKADEGVPLLEGVVARQPNRYEAQVVLGHHYARTGRWSDAVASFEAYFKNRPRGVASEDYIHRLDQANAYLRLGKADTARGLYQQVVDHDGKNEMARLGVAWSSAVLDCGSAMKALSAVADLEAKYAEVSIVRARCALTLGNLDAALDGADRYRARRPGDASGWALLGDIRAAKGNLKAAETAFNEAVRRDPKSPLYALKLARAERLQGKHAAAIELLRRTGAPSGYDELWTLELAEAMYASGQYAQVRDHLKPWVQAHPEQTTARFLLGASLLELHDIQGALENLEPALARQPPEERARAPLINALNAAAVASIGSNDISGAEVKLSRADGLGGSVLTWRNLGAVRLKLGKTADALAVLRKADRDKKDGRAAHLLARALHASGQLEEARATYRRAIRLPGVDAVALGTDLAIADLAAGHGEDAVDSLQELLGVVPAEGRAKLTRIYVETARSAATDWMRTGQFPRAMKVLRQVDAKLADSDPATTAIRCDLALAATGSAQRDVALDYLHRIEKSRARCPFAAPADEVAVPILIAWNEGTQLRASSKALDRLERLRRQATGAAEPLVRMAARDIALRAADEAYDRNLFAEARKYLAEAEKYDRKSPELGHNLAVLDLAAGRTDAALARLTRLSGEVPEAMVNIGIAYDRRGEPLRALEQYRRALAAGARFAPLKAWIDIKEKLWAGSGEAQ